MENKRGISFVRVICYCFLVWIIWTGLMYLSGRWFFNKAENAVKDFEQSYTEAQKEALELVGDISLTSSGSYGFYTYSIEGILKNVSGRKLDYAQISFVIYDTSGNNIGSAFDNVNYIDANGTWRFKATYFGQEPNIKYSKEPEITVW